MWGRTFAGLFLGLFLNVSIMVNIAYLVPIHREVYFLIGFVGGFLLWAGIATYYFCVENFKKSLIRSTLILLTSGSINALLILDVL